MLGDNFESLKQLFQQRSEIKLAILFGSIAMKKERYDSDIDIAVDMGHPMTAEERTNLIDEISSLTARPVDLIDLTKVGEPLLGQILKKGRRFVGSDDAYAALLSRHLIDQADFMPFRNRILEERRRAWIDS